MLHRPGDTLVNHYGSSQEMILRVTPVHGQVHAYHKPQQLCELLVGKHSRPGDLVFDACGCTGAMRSAAINCGRCWVYAESNEEIFGVGAARIAARMAEISSVVS